MARNPQSRSFIRFVKARTLVAQIANDAGHSELAKRILEFQFRDSRPKATSEIDYLAEASKLLGHRDKQITHTVYRRVGESVTGQLRTKKVQNPYC